MRKVQGLMAALLAIPIAGCATIAGSGNVITESRNVTGFTAVSLSGDGKLFIETGDAESLTITTDDNILPYLTSDVWGGELRLGIRNHVSLSPTRGITYKLTAKTLRGIAVSGDGSVDGKGINSDELKIAISGDGSIALVGNAERQEIAISGDGSYRGENLKSKTATVTSSGDGNAVLAVSVKLTASVSGDGSIEYIGDPVVTQRVSGDGSIRKR